MSYPFKQIRIPLSQRCSLTDINVKDVLYQVWSNMGLLFLRMGHCSN